MYQVVEMTYEEKVAMYKKVDKEQLIKMLIECGRIIDHLTKPLKPYKV